MSIDDVTVFEFGSYARKGFVFKRAFCEECTEFTKALAIFSDSGVVVFVFMSKFYPNDGFDFMFSTSENELIDGLSLIHI